MRLIQTFYQGKRYILEFHQGLSFVVFHELLGIVLVFKRNQLPAHGSVNVAADDIGRLIGIDGSQIVVIRHINGCDVGLSLDG